MNLYKSTVFYWVILFKMCAYGNLCYCPPLLFSGIILHFVSIVMKNYCGYQKKKYLCIVVDQRVILKLSQLIGY